MSLLQDVRGDKNIALGIAREHAPFEYGNLRFNAIKAFDTYDGFVVHYDLSSAFYIYFQEEGTRFTTKNQGFIGQRTYPAIASFFQAKYQDRDGVLEKYYLDQASDGNYDTYK